MSRGWMLTGGGSLGKTTGWTGVTDANSATITSWTQTLGTSYHSVTGVQRGRTLKLGASFDF